MVGVVSPFVLLVLACPIQPLPRECVAVVAEVASIQECRSLYQEIKASLPAGMALGFPECHRPKQKETQL